MASSSEFKEALRAGKLKQALILAMSQATELKITTWVASASDSEQLTSSSCLQTRINLIRGQLENEIGEQLLDNSLYRELWQFHLEQVTEGNQIIQENLGSLQKLFEILMTLQQQNPEGFHQQLPLREFEGQRSLFAATTPNSETEPQAPVVETFPPQTTEAETETSATDESDATEDWDDSVLDVLESFPAQAPPQTQTSEAEELAASEYYPASEQEAEEAEEPTQEEVDEIISLEDLELEDQTTSPVEEDLEDAQTDKKASDREAKKGWGDWLEVESDVEPANAQRNERNVEAPKSELAASQDWEDDEDEEFSDSTEENQVKGKQWGRRLKESWLKTVRPSDIQAESEKESSAPQEDELFTGWPEEDENEQPQEPQKRDSNENYF